MSEKLLTDEELRAIAERTAQATPGPWILHAGQYAASVYSPDSPEHDPIFLRGGWSFKEQDNRDAAFIAAARSDVPRLLTDLHRYLAWSRRLVAIAREEGHLYPAAADMLALAEEVRASLEDKA